MLSLYAAPSLALSGRRLAISSITSFTLAALIVFASATTASRGLLISSNIFRSKSNSSLCFSGSTMFFSCSTAATKSSVPFVLRRRRSRASNSLILIPRWSFTSRSLTKLSMATSAFFRAVILPPLLSFLIPLRTSSRPFLILSLSNSKATPSGSIFSTSGRSIAAPSGSAM